MIIAVSGSSFVICLTWLSSRLYSEISVIYIINASHQIQPLKKSDGVDLRLWEHHLRQNHATPQPFRLVAADGISPLDRWRVEAFR